MMGAVRAHLTAVHARISEETPRDLRGVSALADHLEHRGLGPAVRVAGRDGPFARTRWWEDLAAARHVLQDAGEEVSLALAGREFPVTLASDCALALATLPAVDAAVDDVAVLWLDAHADYDTPDTQTTAFLGCMSLAGACGAWDSGLGSLSAGQIVHVGARAREGDFDYAGEVQARRDLRAVVAADGAADAVAALEGDPVYVHLDPDVLDPSVFPVQYGRPGGLEADSLLELLDAVAARGPIVGIEVTAFHAPEDSVSHRRVCGLLSDAIGRCLRASVNRM
jgi:arginase family enzyme